MQKLGLKKAVSGSYDVIVVDLMLPHKDGYEIIREIRKTQEIPILVVSAKNEDIDKLIIKEYEVLLFLASNPNIVFSKEHIFSTIWSDEYCGDTATVAVHIQKIRKKIEKDPTNPEYIETLWGSGYRFNPV